MFLTTMPDLTASYFANKDYHGATLDCSHKYPEHSPQEKACTHGNGIGATYGGYSSAAQSACTFLFSPVCCKWRRSFAWRLLTRTRSHPCR